MAVTNGSRDDGSAGFGQPITLPASAATFREVLRDEGTRRWLAGAAIAGLLLILGNGHDIAARDSTPAVKGLIWLHLVAYVICFALGPPMGWTKGARFKIVVTAGYFALSLPFFAYSGSAQSAAWVWTYVAVFIGVQSHQRAIALAMIAALGAGALLIQIATGYPLDIGFSQPVTIVSLGLMMMAFSRQLNAIRQLRQTQHELAELAVLEERNRVARGMHDILGHSLTVIAVKAELAGRLLEVAPERAAVEIAELEDLARGALVDVRATVSGYRGVNVLSELANARTALTAAGIQADLPGAADSVRAKDRELFGWVLREGITNVVRHSGATRCTVTIGSPFIQIDDDGVGPVGAPDAPDARAVAGPGEAGNGLRGLSERVRETGGSLSVGRSAFGGFQLRLNVGRG
ncbi:MAG: histidine kinase [Actinomycetota bacterium]|nr:histidine kinase [Actinomycetota bacterium]